MDARSGEVGIWRALRARLSTRSTRRRSRRNKYWWTLLFALLPALIGSIPIIVEIPSSYDHATHLFKAWHFWEELVPSGRVRGWSNYWAFGFPSDELVPCGGELWVGLFRGLTLGLLPWDRTYAVAFAALLVFKSFAAFRFARLYFGTRAAVICAWLCFFDPGGQLEGGWKWYMEFGVWPVTLCASLVLLSFERLESVLRGGRSRDVLLGGLLFGAALTTHQLALVAFVILVPLFFLDHLLRARRPDVARYFQVLGATALGFCLSAFYLLPFLTRTDQTLDLGWIHEPLSEISQRFVEMRTFQGMWMPFHALGVLGCVLALRKRRPGSVFFVAASGLFILLASDTLVADLHLHRALPTLIKVEVTRMLLLAKLFWLPLASHALVEVARLPMHVARLSPVRLWAARAILTGLGLALIVPSWRSIYETQIDREIVGQREMKYWQDFQPFIEWSREERRSHSEHYRIAYRMRRTDHSSSALPVYNETPIYKIGYTPTQIFNKLPWVLSPNMLRATNSKYVLSTVELPSPTLSFERMFGRLFLYSFKYYKPEPFTLTGAGKAELLEFEDERVRVRLSGTDTSSRLKLHIASYPRWRASINGAPAPIETVTVAGVEDPMLMEIAASDGELLLEYVYRGADWIGLLLTLGALPGFVGLVWLERRRGLLTRGVSLARRHGRALSRLSLLLLLGVAVVVALRTRSRQRLLPATSIFHQVEASDLTLGGTTCRKLEPLVFQCGENRLEARPVTGSVWGVHLCMHTTAAGPLEVRLRKRMGSFVKGFYSVPMKGTGTIEARLDGASLGKIKTRHPFLRRQFLQYDTRKVRGRESSLELSLEGVALNCFDFRVTE